MAMQGKKGPSTLELRNCDVAGDKASRVIVAGTMPQIFPGERVTAVGDYQYDHKQGDTLTLSEALQVGELVDSIECEDSFFLSHSVTFVGPSMYTRLKDVADHYNTTVIDMMINQRWLLECVDKVGPKRAQKICDSLDTILRDRSLYLFLQKDTSMDTRSAWKLTCRLSKIHAEQKEEGRGDAIDYLTAMREDPYRLVEAGMLDFETVDTIAQDIGLDPYNSRRIVAGLTYELKGSRANGNCGLPTDDAIRTIQMSLNLGTDRRSVNTIRKIVENDKNIVRADIRDSECCFTRDMYNIERSIAKRCALLAGKMAPPWGCRGDVEILINEAEEQAGMHLSRTQQAALQKIMCSNLTFMLGGPGVGKTRITGILIRALKPLGVKVLAAAPTGRAAARLRESTGVEAMTLHRLLQATKDGQVGKNKRKPLQCDLVIIDEASMVDVYLMRILLNAIPDDTALLLIGDVNQLPPVGPGDLLVDLVNMYPGHVVRLEEVHRQRENSSLIDVAHCIKDGVMPPMDVMKNEHADVQFVQENDAEDAVTTVVDLVTNKIPKALGIDPVMDIQVLCPTKGKGPLSTEPINKHLQNTLNHAHYVDTIHVNEDVFRVNDKVMQIVNSKEKEVHNGETGRIAFIDSKAERLEEALRVNFPNYQNGGVKTVSYTRGEVHENLRLAYACTVHKSQGCEYKVVVIVLSMDQSVMLRRSLLYTAFTRAQQRVYIVGQETALLYAIGHDDQPGGPDAMPRRWTLLSSLAQGQSACEN